MVFNRWLNGSQTGGVLVQGSGGFTLHFLFVFRCWVVSWGVSWGVFSLANNTPNYPFCARKCGFLRRKHPFNYHLTAGGENGEKPLFMGVSGRLTGV